MLRPLPGRRPPEGLAAPSILEAPLSIVTGPAGTYVAEALASVIEVGGNWHDCVWLRQDDGRDTAVADALATACRHRWINVGTSPNPAAADAWRTNGRHAQHSNGRHSQHSNGHRATLSLANDDATLHNVIRAAPERAVIVLELDDRLTPALGRLLADLRPVAADHGVSLVAVSEHRVGLRVVGQVDQVIPAASLAEAVDPGSRRDDSILPSACLARLARLSSARPAILNDIVAAARLWPPDAIVEAIAGAWSWRLLVDRVTRSLVARAEASHLEALEICVATGYWHPRMATDGPPVSELRPWVMPLEQQWGWLRPVWRRALARHLRARTGSHSHDREPSASARRGGSPAHAPSGTISLDVRMLGVFEVRVDGIEVALSPGRGASVLRYLLSRPGHTASRDELLEEFWPDVEPAVARNRLQVAVSGVRRALREVTPEPLLEYRNGSYRISPQVRVDVDTEDFEKALAAARAAEQQHDTASAMTSYRRGVGLYRGDFAADGPYEQWTLLPRESLRLRYVDALDRMSGMQLSAGRVDECIATAHRMLDVDPCREDAHRLLMRCYAGQGRAHQALRQFELCRRVLGTTLEVAPSSETIGLREAIRRGSPLPA